MHNIILFTSMVRRVNEITGKLIKQIINRRMVLVLFYMNEYTQHIMVVNNNQFTRHVPYVKAGRRSYLYSLCAVGESPRELSVNTNFSLTLFRVRARINSRSQSIPLVQIGHRLPNRYFDSITTLRSVFEIETRETVV